MAGVTLTLNGYQNASTQTDSVGDYSFTGLAATGNYTITPTKAGFTFNPQSSTITGLAGNQSANFTATRATYTLSGRLSDSGGSALSSVTMTLGGAANVTTQTDASGNYSFAALPSEGNYSITPALANYSFSPVSKSFTNLLGNQTADFTGTRLAYSISGSVTNASGVGQAGVSVALSGGQSAATQTDAAGNYSFNNLPAGLDYIITPSKNHYSFAPASRSLTNLSANQTANFTATLLQHDIGGRVVNASGNPLAGVTVALSGSQTASATTDANGDYVFAALAAGGNYAVSASKPYYGFSPTTQVFNDLSANQSANFTGALLTYAISGRVTENGVGVPGVVITLSGGQSASVQTDATGFFVFNGLAAGSTYTITPSHPFFAFLPAFRNFPALNQNQASDFIATRLTYQVSGSVLDACGQAISGVTLTLAHDGINVSASTNASGGYAFSGVQAGFNYALTPALTGYTFTPTGANFAALNSNQVANFTGTPPTAIVTVEPSADAYVRGGSNANQNFGTSTQLITRLASSAGSTYESYLTFDVGQLCSVTSVKLRLFGKLSSSGNLSVSAYAVPTTSWTETGLTWNNKPATASQLATTTLGGTTATWYEWDITPYVRSEISAGRRLISIALKGVASTSNQVILNSRQATTNKPGVVITKP